MGNLSLWKRVGKRFEQVKIYPEPEMATGQQSLPRLNKVYQALI
jgi:hypothetical protein